MTRIRAAHSLCALPWAAKIDSSLGRSISLCIPATTTTAQIEPKVEQRGQTFQYPPRSIGAASSPNRLANTGRHLFSATVRVLVINHSIFIERAGCRNGAGTLSKKVGQPASLEAEWPNGVPYERLGYPAFESGCESGRWLTRSRVRLRTHVGWFSGEPVARRKLINLFNQDEPPDCEHFQPLLGGPTKWSGKRKALGAWREQRFHLPFKLSANFAATLRSTPPQFANAAAAVDGEDWYRKCH